MGSICHNFRCVCVRAYAHTCMSVCDFLSASGIITWKISSYSSPTRSTWELWISLFCQVTRTGSQIGLLCMHFSVQRSPYYQICISWQALLEAILWTLGYLTWLIKTLDYSAVVKKKKKKSFGVRLSHVGIPYLFFTSLISLASLLSLPDPWLFQVKKKKNRIKDISDWTA